MSLVAGTAATITTLLAFVGWNFCVYHVRCECGLWAFVLCISTPFFVLSISVLLERREAILHDHAS
jgi:hypothetical protein